MGSEPYSSVTTRINDGHGWDACPVCGANGKVKYPALIDHWFESPGRWRMLGCPDAGCGALWLAPPPSSAELAAAYSNYYTHSPTSDEPGSPWPFASRLKRVMGVERRRRRIYLMYLDAATPGRLLDVGCGNGDRLLQFENLGWEVEGQEVDPEAQLIASSRGLKVHLGDLPSLGLDAGRYDAIILNHVVEHLRDAPAVLRECRRLLAPGGRLVVVTPNAASFGHRLFRSAWRGLEPPRHLVIHTRRSLETLCRMCGFSDVEAFCDSANATFFYVSSLGANDDLRAEGLWRSRWRSIASWSLFMLARALELIDHDIGEESVVVARP